MYESFVTAYHHREIMYYANRRGETSRRVTEDPSEHGANHELGPCVTHELLSICGIIQVNLSSILNA